MNPLVILSGGKDGLLARETFVTYLYIYIYICDRIYKKIPPNAGTIVFIYKMPAKPFKSLIHFLKHFLLTIITFIHPVIQQLLIVSHKSRIHVLSLQLLEGCSIHSWFVGSRCKF